MTPSLPEREDGGQSRGRPRKADALGFVCIRVPKALIDEYRQHSTAFDEPHTALMRDALEAYGRVLARRTAEAAACGVRFRRRRR